MDTQTEKRMPVATLPIKDRACDWPAFVSSIGRDKIRDLRARDHLALTTVLLVRDSPASRQYRIHLPNRFVAVVHGTIR